MGLRWLLPGGRNDSNVATAQVPAPPAAGRAAAAVDWIAQAIESDVLGTLRALAGRLGEKVDIEHTRLTIASRGHGEEWKYTWKVGSQKGQTCRVEIAIADAMPDVVKVDVNSRSVVLMATPWDRASRAMDDKTRAWMFQHVMMRVSFELDTLLSVDEAALYGQPAIALGA
jgi:hypothetical protein